MDIFQECGFSDELEIEGVWAEIPGDAAILVARFGNENHQQRMFDLRTKHKAELDADTPAAKKLSKDLLIQTMVETILLGWRGMSFNGKPMEYTKANATKALAYRTFRELVLAKAFDNEAYRAKVLEEDLGN